MLIVGQRVCFPGGEGSLVIVANGTAHIQTPEGVVAKPASEVRSIPETAAPETAAPETPPGINPATGEETRDTSQIPREPGEQLEVGVVEQLPPGTCIVASEGPLGPDSPSAYDAPVGPNWVDVELPKRITDKWCRERSPEELRGALKKPELSGRRRQRVEKELQDRGFAE